MRPYATYQIQRMLESPSVWFLYFSSPLLCLVLIIQFSDIHKSSLLVDSKSQNESILQILMYYIKYTVHNKMILYNNEVINMYTFDGLMLIHNIQHSSMLNVQSHVKYKTNIYNMYNSMFKVYKTEVASCHVQDIVFQEH